MTNVNVNQGDGNVGGNKIFPTQNNPIVTPTPPPKNLSSVTDQLGQASHLAQEGLQTKGTVYANPILPSLPTESVSKQPTVTHYDDLVNASSNLLSSPAGQPLGMGRVGGGGGYSNMTFLDFFQLLAEVLFALRVQMAKEGIVPDAIDNKYLRSVIETWLGAKWPFHALHPRITEISSAKNEMEKIKHNMKPGGNNQVNLVNSPKLLEQLNQLGMFSNSDNTTVSMDEFNQMLMDMKHTMRREMRELLGILGEPVRELLTLDHLSSPEISPDEMTHHASQQFLEVMEPAEKLLKKLINGDVLEIIKSSNLSPTDQKILQDLVRGVVTILAFEHAMHILENEGKTPTKKKLDLEPETLETLVQDMLDSEVEDLSELLRMLKKLLERQEVLDELLAAGSKIANNLRMAKETEKIMYDNLSI